jgi:hypothetical protein
MLFFKSSNFQRWFLLYSGAEWLYAKLHATLRSVGIGSGMFTADSIALEMQSKRVGQSPCLSSEFS